MRAFFGLGLIGLLFTGGVWVKNAIGGSDTPVCKEIHHMYAVVHRAFITGDATEAKNYKQSAFDFEFNQVRDVALQADIRHMESAIKVKNPTGILKWLIASNKRCLAMAK